MKQRITNDQIYELDGESIRKLEFWCFEHDYFLTHNVPGQPARFTKTDTYESFSMLPMELSIGQMIEFLDKHDHMTISIKRCWDSKRSVADWKYINTRSDELCDALWEAVKQVLETQE